MTNQTSQPPYTLGPDDKVAPVMIYTATSLYWGDAIVKSVIRVSTWLRTNAVPDRICLYNAKGIITTIHNAHPTSYTELHIAVSQIYAFHLMPPAKDPVDFDPTEPNRKMEPINALFGTFSVKGNLRLSAVTNLQKYLEVARETFTSIYDVEITNLALPSMGVISIPFMLVRQEPSVFTHR